MVNMKTSVNSAYERNGKLSRENKEYSVVVVGRQRQLEKRLVLQAFSKKIHKSIKELKGKKGILGLERQYSR